MVTVRHWYEVLATDLASGADTGKFEVGWLISWHISVVATGPVVWNVEIHQSFDGVNFYALDTDAYITMAWTEASAWVSRTFVLQAPLRYIRVKNNATWWTIDVYLSYIRYV